MKDNLSSILDPLRVEHGRIKSSLSLQGGVFRLR